MITTKRNSTAKRKTVAAAGEEQQQLKHHQERRLSNVDLSKKFLLEPPLSFYRHLLKNTLGDVQYVTSLLMTSVLFYVCFFMAAPMFIYAYLITYPMLYIHRCVSFTRQKWQFYLIDFCYMANALLYVYCLVYHVMSDIGNESNQVGFMASVRSSFFVLVWQYCNGPVMLGVYVYRNSFVFNDLDKLTSVFLHLAPPGVTWVMRWHSSINQNLSIDMWSILCGWLLSLVVTVAYNVLYNFGVQYLWATRPDRDELEHSFTYQRCQPKYAFFDKKHGHLNLTWQLAWFSIYSDMYILGSGLLSLPLLFSFHLHTIAIIGFYVIALYNGFTFHQKQYRDYLKKYVMQKQ